MVAIIYFLGERTLGIQSFKDLDVWKLSFELTRDIYRVTRSFPKDENFGLVSQIRRSAVSIPSNISEGYGRHSSKEFSHFLNIANGLLCELETQILIAGELGYLDKDGLFDSLVQKIRFIGGKLYNLRQSLKKK